MKQATIRSVCECQSKLEAILDENRHVLAGFVIGPDHEREIAPAHSIEAQSKRFDVGWLCNICGRNTLRSFDAEGLVWRDVDPPAVAKASSAVPPAPRVPTPAPPVASRPPASGSSSPAPPNVATAVALKSLISPSKPPSVPPKPASNPPGPPKTS